MKFSTSASLALLATSLLASVHGRTYNRATRGRRSLFEEEEIDEGKGKGGKGSEMIIEDEDDCDCEGFFFYKYVDFLVDTPWIKAYKATPDDCVLTPVKNQGELLEIGEAAQGNNAWVGILKNAGDVADFPNTALNASWYNLDGSAVPACDELWGATGEGDPEPNNDMPYQTRAHWLGTFNVTEEAMDFQRGLRDINAVPRDAGPMITGAVYKCCALNVNTCYNFPEVEEDEVEDGSNSTNSTDMYW